MPRLLDRQKYSWQDQSLTLQFYYWPLIGRLYHLRVDRALSLLDLEKCQKPLRVLEVGYGSGTSFLELAERFDEIHGLDIHDDNAVIAKRFTQEGIEVHLKQGSILDPPYDDGYFNTVLAISILEHLQPGEQIDVMSQVNRVLRPGGTFVVGVPALNTMMTLAFRLFGYDINEQHFSPPEVVLEAASKVFAIDKVVKLPAFGPECFNLYTWFKARKT